MHVLVQFITLVEVFVIMHWRLQSRQRKLACAMCKGNTLSVILAMYPGGTQAFVKLLHDITYDTGPFQGASSA